MDGMEKAAAAKQILIVDDYSLVAESLALLLEEVLSGPVTIRTASDGGEGMALALAHRPHAVMLDYDMPVMNGLDVALAIRRSFSEVPSLICITGNLTKSVAMKTYGAFDFVFTKPVEIDHLVALLDAV